MSAFRNPVLPIGIVLVVLGFGNWYTGRGKAHEYELLLDARHMPANVADFAEFPELTERTNATLLAPLQRGGDESDFVSAKLDFYRVVQSGGRIIMLAGLFCAAAGLIHAWYRQRRGDVESLRT